MGIQKSQSLLIKEQQEKIDLQSDLQTQVQKIANVEASLDQEKDKPVVAVPDDAQIQEDAKLKIQELESLVEYHLSINDKLNKEIEQLENEQSVTLNKLIQLNKVI